ncbi:MAG: hypothetical protein V3S26_08525, partial [Acidimicrobiia bacterium]
SQPLVHGEQWYVSGAEMVEADLLSSPLDHCPPKGNNSIWGAEQFLSIRPDQQISLAIAHRVVPPPIGTFRSGSMLRRTGLGKRTLYRQNVIAAGNFIRKPDEPFIHRLMRAQGVIATLKRPLLGRSTPPWSGSRRQGDLHQITQREFTTAARYPFEPEKRREIT